MVNRRMMLAGFGAATATLVGRAESGAESQTQSNKAVVTRYIEEVVNGGKLDVIDEIVAEDYTPQGTDDVPGRDALKQRLKDNRETLFALIEDGGRTIDEMVAEGETVAARMRFIGKTTKGRSIDVLALEFFRVTDKQIAAIWELVDDEAFVKALTE